MAVTNIFGFTLPVVGGDNGIWGGENNTDWTNVDSYLGLLRVAAKSVTWNNGGTTTLDLSTGTVFFFTVATGGSTIAFANVPANITAVQLSSPITIVITNGGSQTITWPGSVTWLAGAAPTLQSSGVDVLDLITKDNGTTWFGAIRSPVNVTATNITGTNVTGTGSLKGPIGTATSQAKTGLVLFEAQGLSTTSTSDSSLTSFSLPANSLAVNAQAIRITVIGRYSGANNGLLNIKFGATQVQNLSTGANDSFYVRAIVARTGAATQKSISDIVAAVRSASVVAASPAETLSGAVLIDFRGQVVTSGTLFYDWVGVEYLAS